MTTPKRTPPQRGERVAPPPTRGEWDVVFATSDAADGWEQLGRHAPGPTNECWRRLRTNPLRVDKRQHPLKGTAVAPSGGRASGSNNGNTK